MRSRRVAAVIGLALCGVSGALAQVVPGYTVTDYATVLGPAELSFAPNGTLYTGTNLPTGAGLPAYIHRIGPGGAPVVDYGLTQTPDPDAVLFDGLGMVSGVPGSVLVAGQQDPLGGRLSAILPDEQVVTLHGPDLLFQNPNHMAYDAAGRAIIACVDAKVWACTGGAPLLLFTAASPVGGMDVSPLGDLIYTAASDGIIRVHDTTGGLVNGSFATGIGVGATAALEFGPGGGLWGSDLYALDRQLGNLLRIDALGNPTVIGTGFGDAVNVAGDLEFGPDGALYVSMRQENRVLRIIPEPSALALAAFAVLALRRR